MNQQEKLYNIVRASGIMGVASGIVVIVIGLAAGVVMIVSGARLMFAKRKVLI